MKKFQLVFLFFALILLAACEKTNNPSIPGIVYGEHGIFVVNEGPYLSSNGSVSYMPLNAEGIIPDIFRFVNGVGLGDVVQSMNIYKSRGFIVVNNSQKVEVVRMSDFASLGTITGFSSPRYFLPINNGKAYVSDWSANHVNQVKIVDLNSLTISGTIAVGSGPEQMVMSDNKVYVTNGGGFGNDSTVSVIDSKTNTVVKTIQVGLNPNSIVVEQNGLLLVMCGGTTGPDYISGTSDDVAGMIVEINPVTDSITRQSVFLQSIHPLKLVTEINNHKIYFLHGSDGYTGQVYEFNTNDFTSNPLITGSFYGIGVNPLDGNIYCGRPGFLASDYVLRFTPNGNLVDSILAGIGPNGFVFN